MKNTNHIIRIAVVDDSEFYNRILTKQVEDFVKSLGLKNNQMFQVQSFLHAEDFESNLSSKFDIVLLDYFLGNGKTGHVVLERIKEFSPKSRVAIISQVKNIHTNLVSITKGANAFIEKDSQTLSRVCFFIEDVLNNKILK